jgi:deoxycytidine triphosphate deaminase
MALIPKEAINKLIEEGWILLNSSCPEDKFTPKKNQIQPASIDLTIGIIFRKEKRLDNTLIESVIRYDQPGEIVDLAPGEIVTILTHEIVRLPKHISGTLFPPNSLSVQGVLILNPGHVDPGYCGRVAVRLINFKEAFLPLKIGANIFTMTLEKLIEKDDSDNLYNLENYNNNQPDDKFIEWMHVNVQHNMGKAVFDIDATRLTKEFAENYVSHENLKQVLQIDLEKSSQDFSEKYISRADFEKLSKDYADEVIWKYFKYFIGFVFTSAMTLLIKELPGLLNSIK